MSGINLIQQLARDHVKQVQLFVLCRQSGIILSSVVVARTLSIESVGTLEMLMLCGYLMTFFWSDALLKGYLALERQTQEKWAPSSFLWLCLLVAMATMGLLVLGQRWILPLLVDRTHLEGLALFTLYQVLIVPVWTVPFLGILRGQRSIWVSMYVLLGPALACLLGWQIRPDLTGILTGLVIYAFIGFLWALAQHRVIRDLRIRKTLIAIWPVTWPLILYAISTGVARSFDAWLVARYFDEALFAVFRYGAKEFPLIIALAAGLSTVMIPRLKSDESLHELRVRSTRLMHICYPVAAVLLLISYPAFQWVFGSEYASSAFIFNVYILLGLTQLLFPQSVLTARGDTRWLWYISLMELAVNILASLVLLQYFGMIGIALGTVIAFAFEKGVLLVVLHQRYGIQIHRIMNVRVWTAYAILLLTLCAFIQWQSGA